MSTSDAFLELEALPRRIVLIGGGYVAAEFSHLAARAGAEVTILQRAEPAAAALRSRPGGLADAAVRRRSASASRPAPRSPGSSGAGSGLLVRAARQGAPDLERRLPISSFMPPGVGPDLKAASTCPPGEVAVQDGRLQLDAHLRSISNPRVYAAGDAAGVGPRLTPVSSHDAKVVAANLLDGPIARAGLSRRAERGLHSCRRSPPSGCRRRRRAAAASRSGSTRPRRRTGSPPAGSPSRSTATKLLIDERHGPRPRRASRGAERRRGDQRFRPGHPPRPHRGRSSLHHVRLSDRRLGRRLHALGDAAHEPPLPVAADPAGGRPPVAMHVDSGLSPA